MSGGPTSPFAGPLVTAWADYDNANFSIFGGVSLLLVDVDFAMLAQSTGFVCSAQVSFGSFGFFNFTNSLTRSDGVSVFHPGASVIADLIAATGGASRGSWGAARVPHERTPC